MPAHAEGEGATALSPSTCAQQGCDQPCWVVKVRENIGRREKRQKPPRLARVSEFCREHSELPMFDVPVGPVYAPKPAKGEPRTFQQAVAQRREQREQGEAS
jgi:hypothetical protein